MKSFGENLRSNKYIDKYDERSGKGFIYQGIEKDKSLKRTKLTNGVSCIEIDHKESPRLPSCFILRNLGIGPEDIMYINSTTSGHLRFIFYGSTSLPFPHRDSSVLAPNIAHYVNLGQKMSFTFFMSILSALYLGGVDKVYIHSDMEPWGQYWDTLQERLEERVVHIPWRKPKYVFKQEINTIQHLADTIKSRVMWDYGGILMDPDIMFVRKPDPDFFEYDAVLSPDTGLGALNMGISISKPRSQFAKLWLESERVFIDDNWLWNCGIQTKKIWERNPRLAKIVPYLAMFSIKGVSYPLWVDRRAYIDKKTDVINQVKDWKKEPVAIHFVFPDPYENLEETAYKQTGIVGELGRLILRESGLLGRDEGIVD